MISFESNEIFTVYLGVWKWNDLWEILSSCIHREFWNFKFSLQLLTPTTQSQTSEYEKSGIYKITCKTCQKSYVGQTNRNLNLRFREHVQYIKNNDPCSAFALRILNCRREYGNINETMTLLKQIKRPPLLLPYEQMYILIFRHDNELISEQHLNEQNPMFELL